ncbi:PHP domain-containing protein [Halomonas halocynthiae]|uniref:PHP domain-containing protein n=1 Tax=Halomonas halocynthiae TaxID=176290 RepID=UPI0005523EEC|nr:PHP domain-containing protein [Halomonas halocynthiae]
MLINFLSNVFEGESLNVDLHMHSTASDGRLSPAQLVELCQQRQLRSIALTDHDTMDGVEEAQRRGGELGVQVLPATELSSQWRGINIHVVGLLPSGNQSPLSDGLERQAKAREQRSAVIAERLEKRGLSDALLRARKAAGGDRPLGRPDFARALVDAGMVADMKTAFARYLGNGKPGDVKAMWPYLSEVVDWIVCAGGVAVLAHPLHYGLTRRKRGQLLDDFCEAGGQAAELVSGFQNPDMTRDLARQLHDRELYGSVGSDFHFPGGHLAPGSMSPVPCTAVPPVWTHPRLQAFFGQAA